MRQNCVSYAKLAPFFVIFAEASMLSRMPRSSWSPPETCFTRRRLYVPSVQAIALLLVVVSFRGMAPLGAGSVLRSHLPAKRTVPFEERNPSRFEPE